MKNKTYIESLGIHYEGQMIITDIDDCVLLTSNSIRELGLDKESFWFNASLYNQYKDLVTMNAIITPWGIELLNLIKNGIVEKFAFITHAKDRSWILCSMFKINPVHILEAISPSQRIEWINAYKDPVIYVDNNDLAINSIINPNAITVMYPLLNKKYNKPKPLRGRRKI